MRNVGPDYYEEAEVILRGLKKARDAGMQAEFLAELIPALRSGRDAQAATDTALHEWNI